MARHDQRIILFLGTANYNRCRCAEILFNAAAGKMGLPWKAISRGLALDPKLKGPMTKATVQALQARGLRSADFERSPILVTDADMQSAFRIIALNQPEHQATIQERFAKYADKAEYWRIEASANSVALIDAEVSSLIARLLGGSDVREEAKPVVVSMAPSPAPVKKKGIVRVGRETKGRRGKGVTLVWDIPLNEQGVQELGTLLKQRCGTGGTVKDGRIEIQGDQRDRVSAELEKLGYSVKRVGG